MRSRGTTLIPARYGHSIGHSRVPVHARAHLTVDEIGFLSRSYTIVLLSGCGSRVIFDLKHRLGSHYPEFACGADQAYSSRSQPFDLRDYATRIIAGQ